MFAPDIALAHTVVRRAAGRLGRAVSAAEALAEAAPHERARIPVVKLGGRGVGRWLSSLAGVEHEGHTLRRLRSSGLAHYRLVRADAGGEP